MEDNFLAMALENIEQQDSSTNIFKPYKVLSTELDQLPIKEGQMIITTDTHQIFIDINSTTRKLYGENELNTLFYIIEDNSTEEVRLTKFNELNKTNETYSIFLKYGNNFYIIEKGSLFNNESYYTATAINNYSLTNAVKEFEFGHRLLNITKDSEGLINDVYVTMADTFRSINSDSNSNYD